MSVCSQKKLIPRKKPNGKSFFGEGWGVRGYSLLIRLGPFFFFSKKYRGDVCVLIASFDTCKWTFRRMSGSLDNVWLLTECDYAVLRVFAFLEPWSP